MCQKNYPNSLTTFLSKPKLEDSMRNRCGGKTFGPAKWNKINDICRKRQSTRRYASNALSLDSETNDSFIPVAWYVQTGQPCPTDPLFALASLPMWLIVSWMRSFERFLCEWWLGKFESLLYVQFLKNISLVRMNPKTGCIHSLLYSVDLYLVFIIETRGYIITYVRVVLREDSMHGKSASEMT